MRTIKLFACLILVAGHADSATTRARQPDVARSRAEVEAAMRRYAELIRTGPVDALVSAYTVDGELFEPGMAPLRGRNAIRDFLAPLADRVTVHSSEVATDTLDVRGRTAYQWGTFRQTAGPKGEPPATYGGRYVAEWQKDAVGKWRLRRLLLQPDVIGSSRSEAGGKGQRAVNSATATAEVLVPSEEEMDAQDIGCPSRLRFLKGQETLLELSAPNCFYKQKGGGRLAYRAVVQLEPDARGAGQPLAALRQADLLEVEIDQLPADGEILGGKVTAVLNGDVRLEFAIPAQTSRGTVVRVPLTKEALVPLSQ